MNRPYPWKCHTCHERQVNPVTVDYTADLEHDGRVYPVTVSGLEVLRCGHCGAQVLPHEAGLKLTEALRAQAGLLAPSQIEAKRSALGLSQKDFAYLLGVAPATVCRWENGAQIQQRVMNDFMQAFFDLSELREYLKRLRGGTVALRPVPAPKPPQPGQTVGEEVVDI
jgi:putative zinc finger/helix-turn-helix YgiT family protein